MKIIKGRHFRIGAVNRRVKDQIAKAANGARQDFESTTKHFNTILPEFEIEYSKSQTVARVAPEHNDLGRIWSYLAGTLGTRYRYATMSDDFVPKTTPDTLQTRRGQGVKLYVNTDEPKPGIEPRRWIVLVAEKRGKELLKGVVRVLEGI